MFSFYLTRKYVHKFVNNNITIMHEYEYRKKEKIYDTLNPNPKLNPKI